MTVYPTHVVVDGLDGYVFRNGADGELFTEAAARAFAVLRNSERKPEFRTYRVFTLEPYRNVGQGTREDAGR